MQHCSTTHPPELHLHITGMSTFVVRYIIMIFFIYDKLALLVTPISSITPGEMYDRKEKM